MIGILAEKPSAARNMAKALGGTTGTYNGEQYLIVAARGHLYELVDPKDQVTKALSDKYKSWDLSNLPWDEHELNWKYRPNSELKDISSILSTIKNQLAKCDEVCIGTDDDPTGEGELLAWEILDQLNVSARKWSRMYFVDESAKELQKAFVNRKQIKSMQSDMDYVKAFYRSRWDFMSMQFTRIATKCGDGKSVLRQGRLKSAMVLLVGDALKALNDYKKIPYYQNRFKDENGVVYTNPEEPSFPKKEDVPNAYHRSDVVFDGAQMKSTAPPKMLDLASLSARLVTKGYKAKAITDTYQNMYESQVVSYPRTEDKVITPEQFDELLPLVNKIAKVVGVDSSLLTHRTPRSTHVKTGGAHGANRPGTNVPGSLDELSKYDVRGASGCAKEIYILLAKNYLATLAEDYEYESQKGHVKDFPKFTGTASVPKKMGWKLVYSVDADDEAEANSKGIGKVADPFIYEGFPPKPPVPTMKWLMSQLEKRDVGTGATRTSTYAEVTNEKSKFPLMKDTKGRISMTPYGDMSYRLLPGTNIGSLDVTERLMGEMRDIATGKKDPDVCLHDIRRMVQEDIETMRKNGELMRKELNIMSNGSGNAERCIGTWNGTNVSFKREWGGHRFSDDECSALLAGGKISFEATTKDGNNYTVTGGLAEQEYQGKKYIGFKADASQAAASPDRYSGVWNGENVSFKRIWSGHTFTDDECQRLCAGEVITIEAISSKTGQPYTAKGSLARQKYAGHEYVGFKADFGNNGGSGNNTVPDVWCQHKFTDDEKQILASGLSVEANDFVSSKGMMFTAKVRFGKKDNGYMGIIAEFN